MQSLHRVEKSPSSDGTGGIMAGNLSTQSIMGAFSICPIPTCISARDDDVGERPSRHFDGRSGVEKSPSSDGTGGITAGDLSTQSIMGAFSICPIPTCISVRDDDVGERPSRHFDRSEAEWRNLLPSMVQEEWRQEIYGLRVPHRAPHTGPFPGRDDQGQPLTFMEPE